MTFDPFAELNGITPEDVLKVVSDESGLSVEALVGPDKKHPVVHWRQVGMAACRLATSASFPSIGESFGRDHTTVVHACNRVRESVRATEMAERVVAEARRRHAEAQQQELFA